MKAIIATVFLAFGVGATPALASTTYDGIVFPDGDVSFADEIIDYVIGDGVKAPYNDPTDVLGAPDYLGPAGLSASGAFSLGHPGISPDHLADNLFGYVTVKFTDNSLTTSGDSAADLFVFEVGPQVERFGVEISKNGIDWIFVGTVTGQPSQLDIDGVAGVSSGDQFSYVRVTDAPGGHDSTQPYAGPDIDAIGAISSAAPVASVPLPAAAWALIGALAMLFGLERRRRLAA